MSISLRNNRVRIEDKVVIRDQNGIWKPAVVELVANDGFSAKWVLSAGSDDITVKYDGIIPWRLASDPEIERAVVSS